MSKHDEFAEAIESGNVANATRLIDEHPELVNSPKWTPPPLHCAVLWNQPQIANLLLDRGADIEIRDPDRDTTPLRYAVIYCKRELVRLLVLRGANTGPIKPNGSSAMELAVEGANGEFEEYDDLPNRSHYGEIIELLKENGIE